MSWVWTGMLFVCLLCSMVLHRGAALAASVMQGAQAGLTTAFSIGGALCLWAGVGKLMEAAGITAALSRLLKPFLHMLFPSAKDDPQLSGALSSNICANFLGLGNAATPPGIEAARRMAEKSPSHAASDELCRLIVLNTASIQLLPTNVAAIRSALGCRTPFDLLPAVWIASICSAGLGLTAAIILGKLASHA